MMDQEQLGNLVEQSESGRQLYVSDEEENTLMLEAYWETKRIEVEEAEAEAKKQLKRGNRKAALGALATMLETLRDFQLPDSCVWMDFHSLLDGMLFQDYYKEDIAGREIMRHPLHPAASLYRYGHLLLGMGLFEEALEPLSMLVALDPVCPKYMLELCEAYKQTGNLSDAYDGALWTLGCASTPEQMAACYRLMAYCLEKSGEYPDAIALYRLSLNFQTSPVAEAEITRILRKNGSPIGGNEPDPAECCERLGIPMEINERVKMNQMLLEPII